VDKLHFCEACSALDVMHDLHTEGDPDERDDRKEFIQEGNTIKGELHTILQW
jgi:hypothetical protein